MAWEIEFDASGERDLARLDRPVRARIVDFLESRVAPLVDPTLLGEPLKGKFAGKWRYRVGDWRIICTRSYKRRNDQWQKRIHLAIGNFKWMTIDTNEPFVYAHSIQS